MDLNWLANWYLPAGLLIGFVAAAPIGPVNILVIQRALQRSVRSAMILGLGAALGDTLFAAIAAFGLAALNAELSASKAAMRILGGIIMLGFAVVLWRTHAHLDDPGRRPPPARHMALAIFVMTVTNPATILWFVAMFQAVGFRDIGLHSRQAAVHSGQIILGVLLGSVLWWLCISGFTSLWRHRLTDRHLDIANHVAAVILALSGTAAIVLGALT